MGFAGFLSSYVSAALGAGAEAGAATASIFWGTFTAGRFLAVALAMCVSPQRLLVCSCTIAAGSIATFAANRESLPVIQVVAAVYGLGIAPMFSAAMTSAQVRNAKPFPSQGRILTENDGLNLLRQGRDRREKTELRKGWRLKLTHLLQEYVHVSGRAASILVCGSSIGKSTLPLAITTGYAHYGNVAFPAILGWIVCMEAIAICCMICVGRRVLARFRER
jgi:hypothetical protein